MRRRDGMPFWGKKKPEVASVAPVAKTMLLEKLLALNNPSNPFEIKRSDETDLLIEQRIVDAKWRESDLITEKELKKGYKAWLLLDENTHEARFCEEMATEEKEKKGPFGMGGFSSQKTTFRGKTFAHKESGSSGSLFGGKKDYEYLFDVKKVHDPIRNTVEENGWQFKQVVTKGAATYRK
jgi:hypothetical protein